MRLSLAIILSAVALGVHAMPVAQEPGQAVGVGPSATGGGNLQPFTQVVGGVRAPAVTNIGGDRPFQVENNDNFNNLPNAVTRSCDVFFNQCQNVFNGQPNDQQVIKQGDCAAAADRCRAGDNSLPSTGDNAANNADDQTNKNNEDNNNNTEGANNAEDQKIENNQDNNNNNNNNTEGANNAEDQKIENNEANNNKNNNNNANTNTTEATSATDENNTTDAGNGGNLQPFTASVAGVTAPQVTNVGGGRPFLVEGNSNFLDLQSAIARSCDVFFNQCQNVFNAQPNGQGELKQGDCAAAADKCRQGDNSGSDAVARAPATAGNGGANSAVGGAGDTGDGADVNNDQQANKQNEIDEKANIAADKNDERQEDAAKTVQEVAPAETGGKGGIDPATGVELLPLPEQSEFCSTSEQTPADGSQIPEGFCSSSVQGQIPSVDKMVSSIITSPENGATIPAGSELEVTMVVTNLNTGFFTRADIEYYTQPQTLNDEGVIRGHTHITIQNLGDAQNPPNANEKTFFKGVNDKADGNGVLTVNVPANTITAPGVYRICSMSSSFSHQPVVMPVAQRGAQDDCIRVTVA